MDGRFDTRGVDGGGQEVFGAAIYFEFYTCVLYWLEQAFWLVLVLLGSGCFLIPAWFWRRSMIFVLIAYKYMFLH